MSRRHVNNVRRDLKLLSDSELIEQILRDNKPLKKEGYPVYDKVPLARTISMRYFTGPTLKIAPSHFRETDHGTRKISNQRRAKSLKVPSGQEILDIANSGESQIFEFKGQGVEIQKITREIAAFLNTRQGGQIFYGIDDHGNIEGSDLTSQKLDQPLQNSVRNTISPPPTVRIHAVNVMGTQILVITIPPWDKRHVYMFTDKVLIRKGTNVFASKPEELKMLHVDILTMLLAYQTFGAMPLSESAPILKRLGFSNPQIAAIFASTAKAVSVRLAEAKKK